MDVREINGTAGTMVHISALVDGLRCDVSTGQGELVVRPTAWNRSHEVIARGADVHEALRATHTRLTEECRGFHRDQLAAMGSREPISFLPEPHFLGKD